MTGRVLLVEDEDTLLRALEGALARAGFDVTCASDGNEAMTLFHLLHPALVITDLFMPGKEGIELIMEIRRRAPDTKIVAISGGGILLHTDILKCAVKLGADCALPKPFQLDEVVAAARRLIGTQ